MREGKAFMLVYSIVEKQTYEDLNKIRDKILAIRKNSSYPMYSIIYNLYFQTSDYYIFLLEFFWAINVI